MTERIIFMCGEYLRTKRRNKRLMKAIQDLLYQRKRQLDFLMRSDYNSYAYVVTEYKIPVDLDAIGNMDGYALPRCTSGRAKFSK